jgi:hypothetical protein
LLESMGEVGLVLTCSVPAHPSPAHLHIPNSIVNPALPNGATRLDLSDFGRLGVSPEILREADAFQAREQPPTRRAMAVPNSTVFMGRCARDEIQLHRTEHEETHQVLPASLLGLFIAYLLFCAVTGERLGQRAMRERRKSEMSGGVQGVLFSYVAPVSEMTMACWPKWTSIQRRYP